MSFMKTSDIDITKHYLEEISKYPLLTKEEEQKLGKNLKLKNKLKILNSDNSINLQLIFNSCSNNESYKTVIEILLNYYKKQTNLTDKKIYDQLKECEKKSDYLNRPLTKEEIKELFPNNKEKIEELEEKELLIQIKNYIIYKESFQKLFHSNLRLVVKIAKKYQNYGSLLEIINEGNIGLIKAIEQYDVDLGNKFSTYAFYWIKQMIIKNISEQKHSFKIPLNVIMDIEKLKKEIIQLEQSEGRILSLSEISTKLDIPIDKIVKYLNYDCELLSLEQPVGEDDAILSDFISDDNEQPIDESLIYENLKEDINLLFEVLSLNEKNVIKLRFGLNNENNRKLSLVETGKIIGLSAERVRQLEAKALRKMRIFCTKDITAKKIKEYLR